MDLGIELLDMKVPRAAGRLWGQKVAPYQPARRETPEGSLIKRISQRHHNLARHLANGVKPGEAGVMTGYNASRVSILKSDPAFKELVRFYQGRVDEEYDMLHGKLAALAADAADVLHDRIEDNPDAISIGALLKIVEKASDRSGHGPHSSTSNVHLHGGIAVALKTARQRVEDRNQSDLVLKHQPNV